MPPTIRKISYVLGAGFSFGCGHSARVGNHVVKMPLQLSLFEELCKFHYRRISELDEIARAVRKYFSPNTYRAGRGRGSARHSDLFGLSIEEVVTFFDEVVANKQEGYQEIAPIAEELQTLTAKLIGFLSKNGSPGQNKLLQSFVDRLAQTDVVISFNWDTILDRVLLNRVGWHPDWGYGVAARTQFAQSFRKPPPIPQKYPRLLKLHGSINWSAYQNNGATITAIEKNWHPGNHVSDVIMMPPKMIKTEVWRRGVSGSPISGTGGNKLVPKDFYPDLWMEAEKHLSRCRRIVFIGYSFPPADFAVGNMLRRAISAMKISTGGFPEVDIVDPNAAMLSKRFEQSFKISVPIENQYLSLKSYLQSERSGAYA